ncbi:MAG: DUF2600 family protein [Solirubrobacteraceae bacterium]
MFLTAAARYWCGVYPQVCRDIRYWRGRAERIPDPTLRRLALEAHDTKRSNLEGAAAFAAFAPPVHRKLVVHAQVAFQIAYDYADTLAEQPNERPTINARRLHQALCVALEPDLPQLDYYAYGPYRQDAGYLRSVVDACRGTLLLLPSRATVAPSLLRLCEKIVTYQSLNLSIEQGGHRELSTWAKTATPSAARLFWWETAASAGSSLGVFCLIATAARMDVDSTVARSVEDAYFPWIGALHSLLDSLVDEHEDERSGVLSLLHYYASPAVAAERLIHLAQRSSGAVGRLPDASRHKTILAALIGHYLVMCRTRTRTVKLAQDGLLKATGILARPTRVVMKAQSAVAFR